MTHLDEGAESADELWLYETFVQNNRALMTAHEVRAGLIRWLQTRGIPCSDLPTPDADTPEAR